MIPFLDLTAQHEPIRDEIDLAIGSVVSSGQFVLGPAVEALERDLAEVCGVRHAVGVASGTDALVLSLRALDLPAGAEVITSPFSFVATASAIVLAGAVPVFVDIDPATFNLEPGAIEAAITPRTRVVLPVHLYGQPAQMSSIEAAIGERDIAVVEDAAQAIGARYHGRTTGGLGQLGCFSFYPTKNLGAFGDAGAITTDDPALAERLRMLRNQGQVSRYEAAYVGYNSRLDSIQAAVLSVKLAHIEAWNEARRRVAGEYSRRLTGLPVEVPEERSGIEHVFHQYTIRCVERDALREHLAAAGIATMVYYPVPLHRQPALAAPGDAPQRALPQAERAAREVLSLPIYPELPAEHVERICEGIRAFYRG